VAITPTTGSPFLYQFAAGDSSPLCFSLPTASSRLLATANSKVISLPVVGGSQEIALTDRIARTFLTPQLVTESFLRDLPAAFSGLRAATLVTVDSPWQTQVAVRNSQGLWSLVTPSGISGCLVGPADYSVERVAYLPSIDSFVLLKLCNGAVRALMSPNLINWEVWQPFDDALSASLTSTTLQPIRVLIGDDGSVAAIFFDTATGYLVVRLANSQVDVVAGGAVQGIFETGTDQMLSVLHFPVGVQVSVYQIASKQWHPSGVTFAVDCLNPKATARTSTDIVVVCAARDASTAYARRIRIYRTLDGGATWLAF